MVFLALAFVTVSSLEAHTVGISRGTYRIEGGDVIAEMVFARLELAGALPGLDVDRDGAVSQDELSAAHAQIEALFVDGVKVHAATGLCNGRLRDLTLTEEDGASIRAEYHCPSGLSQDVSVSLEIRFFEALAYGHRHLVSAIAGSSTVHAVTYQSSAAFELPSSAAPQQDAVAWPLFRLGIHHILTGYDHLVFLVGLILVGGRLKPLLAAITAFTVAHSITLGLAVLQVWTPGSRFAESAIALSIAYIGVENWFVKSASSRWLITFPFGLVHGFGFAGALGEIDLPHQQIPAALFSFNAGVETGQLAVLLVLLPAVLGLRRHPWFAKRGVHALSGAIALAGVWWFALRVIE